jgi:hypothetical protein
MKSIQEKLRIIESDLVPKEGAKIEMLSTSVKITHVCGCVLVEHFAAGKPLEYQNGSIVFNEGCFNRKYWIELCDKHKDVKAD